VEVIVEKEIEVPVIKEVVVESEVIKEVEVIKDNAVIVKELETLGYGVLGQRTY